MSGDPGPSARLLAAELRECRKRRKMTGTRPAAVLGCDPSQISRWEHALSQPDEDELRRMLNLYDVAAAGQARLQQLRRKARREGNEGQGDWTLATEVLAWASGVVPVALRTEAYARVVLESVRRIRQVSLSQVKAEIVTVRDWQARLRGEAEDVPPLAVTAIVDEAVLMRRRGPNPVMTAQLDQLASLPGVDLRVLPLDEPGPAFDSFTVLRYGDEYADVVTVDGPAGTERITADQAVMSYRDAFTDLLAGAADADESEAILKRAADRWS